MYRRRRTGLVLPPARRSEEDPIAGDPASLSRRRTRGSAWRFRLRSSGPSSYISSSDSTSSSRSGSPTSRNSMRPRTSQTTSEATRGPSRSGTRPYRHELPHGSSSPDAPPTRDASGPVHRCPLIAHPKPMTRSRRRTLLRSPIFRLILSPDPDNQPTQGNSAPVEDSNPTRTRRNQGGGAPQSVTNPSRAVDERPGRAGQSSRDFEGLRSIIRRAQHQLTSGSVPASSAAQDADARQTAVNAVRSTRPTGREDDDDCVICLDAKSNRSIILPCMHTFCYECIYRWLRINPSCPLCKRLANRIIHSILSDSEFTELPVSEIRPSDSPEFYRPSQYPFEYQAGDEELTAPNQRSHHHFHYHLDAPSFGVFRYLGPAGPSREPPRASVIIPPILIPSDSPGTATAPAGDGSGGRSSNRWNYNLGPSVETCRANLTSLVNGAIRPRDSSLLDGLLLRQLVYIFDFDSVPISQTPDLERDISPDFLRTNEAQRHRLEAFVRRELRVLAPWLAYIGEQTNDQAASVLREERPRDADTSNSPAVTAPLLSGAPGLLTETPELDAVTARVVQHVTSVSISDEAALLTVLCTLPRVAPPFVPLPYLSHFITELIRFARYAGTLEQYDAAVCLYRRRSLRPVSHGTSDPRLASYLSSACWPRLRPGFVQPQGLITHPLINWLLHRLFVHLINGASHPVRLHGTGDHPNLLPTPLNYSASHSPPPRCHPHCLRLSSLTRTLLESIPSGSELRSSRDAGAQSFARGMTPNEMFPNRLLFQRLLSELIDQARFSETLSEHFSHHPNTAYVPGSRDRMTFLPQPPQHVNTAHANLVRPVLDAHALALRRLNGIVQLFTTRGGARLDVDDWLTDLLHTPLLPLASDPVVSRPSVLIDLTGTRPRDTSLRGDTLGADWNFLTQSPWNFVLWNSSNPFRESPTPSTEEASAVRSTPAEQGWRNRTGSCVVISSDSSEDELGGNMGQAPSSDILTADEEEAEAEQEHRTSGRLARNQTNEPHQRATCSNQGALNEIEATTSSLSLIAGTSGGAESNRHASTTPEPMDVDSVASVAFKRSAPVKQSEDSINPPSPSAHRPAKLAKVDTIFADIIRHLRGTSDAPVSESQTIQREDGPSRSRHRHSRRHHHLHHSRTRSPIRVDSSGSDCELVHEYIRVDSRSPSISSCSSDSTASCSTSTPTPPHVRSSHRHYTCHKYCSHRHHWHHRCSCCMCRRRRAKCVHRHCRPRHHHHRHHHDYGYKRFITVNSKTSPILISDDDDDGDARAEPDLGSTSAAAATTSQPVESPPTTSNHTVNQNCGAVKLEFVDPVPGPSTSYTPSRTEVSIFEPTSVDDFYRFLERFLPAPPTVESPPANVSTSTMASTASEDDDEDDEDRGDLPIQPTELSLANEEEEEEDEVNVEVTDPDSSDDESLTDHPEEQS